MYKPLLFAIIFAAMLSPADAETLYDVIKGGEVAKVKQFIANGQNANQKHKTFGTPLHHAAIWGSAEMAELLISAGADVNAQDQTLGTPLHRAARKGNEGVAAVLIAHGANVSARMAGGGRLPLHDAAEGGHAGMIDFLIACGAKPNAKSTDSSVVPGKIGWAGYPAVHAAGSGGHFDIVDLLKAYGAQSPGLKPLAAVMPSASPAEGEKVFGEFCTACHSAEKGGLGNVGANLWGIIGKKKAGIDGFPYSPSFGRLIGTWTLAETNAFIAAPTAFVPGTKMRIEDMPDPLMRANLVAFLRLLSDEPVPLPQAVPCVK